MANAHLSEGNAIGPRCARQVGWGRGLGQLGSRSGRCAALHAPQGLRASGLTPSSPRTRPAAGLACRAPLPECGYEAPGLSLWPHSAVSLTSFTAALRSASVVGVSGARAPLPASLSACRWALGQLAPSAVVVTGCASGVDACARALCPSARVLRVSAFGGIPAARSVAVVRAVAAGAGPGGALWLAFPAGPCPSGRVRGRALAPSRSASACFAGYGSGTWASLALAVGLGVPALAFLPPGVAAPAGWGLAPCPAGAGPGGAWVGVRPVVVQASLFG